MSTISDNPKIKTKSEFLSNLEFYLYKYLDKKDVVETLSDYNDFFDVGFQNGTSELELIAQFGSPQDIAFKLYTATMESSSKKKNRKADTQFIVMLRILLVTATILFIFLLRKVPNFIRIDGNFHISFFLPPLVLVACLMLYFVHRLFNKKLFPSKRVLLTDTQNLRINKALLICSYIFPAIGNITMIGGLCYIVCFFSPERLPYQTFYSAHLITSIIANTAEISILCTAVLAVILATREKTFSLIKTGLQIAVLTYTFSIFDIMSNLDLNDTFISSVNENIKTTSCIAICSILIVVISHICMNIFSKRKTIANTMLTITIIGFAVSFVLQINVDLFSVNHYGVQSSIWTIVFILMGIFLSFYTKRNPAFCLLGKKESKLSLISLLLSSCLAIMISIFTYIYSQYSFNQDSSMIDEYMVSAILFSLLFLSSMISVFYASATAVYLSNDNAKTTNRYLCLIATAPLVIMNNIVTLFSNVNIYKAGWRIWLSSDIEQMWRKTIIMCVIVIAVPLITFGVLQIRKSINTKNITERC